MHPLSDAVEDCATERRRSAICAQNLPYRQACIVKTNTQRRIGTQEKGILPPSS